MTRRFLWDAVGWGSVLWFLGYVAGIALFFLVPPSLIGWVITPIATLLTVWVALRKISNGGLVRYLGVGLVWLVIALSGDYLFIVKLLQPPDGYYKPDVYLYYALTGLIPLLAGAWRTARA